MAEHLWKPWTLPFRTKCYGRVHGWLRLVLESAHVMQVSHKNLQSSSRKEMQLQKSQLAKLNALEAHAQKLEADLAAQLQEVTGQSLRASNRIIHQTSALHASDANARLRLLVLTAAAAAWRLHNGDGRLGAATCWCRHSMRHSCANEGWTVCTEKHGKPTIQLICQAKLAQWINMSTLRSSCPGKQPMSTRPYNHQLC